MDLSNIFDAKWKQLRGKAKEQWGELTDDDLDKVEGQLDQLIGVIMEKYELNYAKAEKEVKAFLSKN